MDSDNGGRSQTGPQLDTAPGPPVVSDSGRQPPAKGGEPSVPMTAVHPEASDNLVEALQSASLGEGHYTLMSMVIAKVQSAKSGLTEACASLLAGFQVSNLTYEKVSWCRQ